MSSRWRLVALEGIGEEPVLATILVNSPAGGVGIGVGAEVSSLLAAAAAAAAAAAPLPPSAAGQDECITSTCRITANEQ